MNAVRTARVEREEKKAAISEALDLALRSNRLTQAAIAETLGVSETMVAEWCKPEKPRAITVADAARLPEPARMAMAIEVAGPGHAVGKLPAAASSGDDLRAIANVQRECADVVARHLDAMADGRLSRAEGAELEREVDQAIAALLAVKLRAQQAQRELVIAFRRDEAAAE